MTQPDHATQRAPHPDEVFAQDVLAGLSSRPKTLSSRYFYDATGSSLFERIMDLPEYYLTRCERAIIEAHCDAMASAVTTCPSSVTVMDLGAGNGDKTTALLRAIRSRSTSLAYAPVDVSRDALAHACSRASAAVSDVSLHAIETEYLVGLKALARLPGRRLVLFLGSNIGNMDRLSASEFLGAIRRALVPGDHLLVGWDLVKDPALLVPAYSDTQGITAAFNFNLLTRINRELGANFDVGAFSHYASYDPKAQAMESFLISKRAQSVEIAGRSFAFEPWEAVKTEASHKYTRHDLQAFAAAARFEALEVFVDEREWFADTLWKVPEDRS